MKKSILFLGLISLCACNCPQSQPEEAPVSDTTAVADSVKS